ncbi:probable prolyl 4-hydroxylase 9 isoform X3 [Solanum tuberosum]|uniref:probable prolyl 4-hydroxylase 9 isoform X3 n=1 Tax=Solanum tuberosum TaxID=4113 RepID=UPI00073A3112|nr:PREDICTED: probable prolyl 4-hydroxylase 9 isoform X3 [Solanum tuberosum]
MKSKGRFVGQRWWSIRGLPSVFLLCLFFFLAGLFGSTLISHQDVQLLTVRPRSRVLESVEEFDVLPNGDTGEHSLTSIPFQVLSWFPRALYFPNFATIEQCQGIIKMAKADLKPSSLALRKGETAENTKGIRTSSGMFISASEDKTGILDLIEEKIAKATMIPRTHGEAFNVLRYETGQSYHSHYDAFDPSQYGPQKSQRCLVIGIRWCCFHMHVSSNPSSPKIFKKMGKNSLFEAMVHTTLVCRFIAMTSFLHGITMVCYLDHHKVSRLKIMYFHLGCILFVVFI